MAVDILIRNGKIVTAEGVFDSNLLINDGKVLAITNDIGGTQANRVIDATGKYILPGLIDPHMHIGIYHHYDEELASESAAAIAGGTTTLCHMFLAPMDEPIIESYTAEVLSRYRDPIPKLSRCDIAFIPVIWSETHLCQIEYLVSEGMPTFKFFPTWVRYSITGEIATDERAFGFKGVDHGFLYKAFEKIKREGGLPRVHCENVEIHRALYPIYQKRTDPEAYYLHRPPVSDEVEISTVCAIANSIGCPVYIVHLNNANGIDIINNFRAKGAHVELETCLHYLVVDQTGTGIKYNKIAAKTSPPPRTREDLERLWWGIKEGFINHVGSDHGAQTIEEKLPPGGNIWNVTMGGPYVQEVLPIMLSEGVNKRGLSMQTLVETCSKNNAIVQGMYPRKGTILPGSDADLVVVDLKKRVRFTSDLLKGSSGYSLVEDWDVTGWPTMTILRGKVVMENDQLTGNQGDGRFVKCALPFALKTETNMSM